MRKTAYLTLAVTNLPLEGGIQIASTKNGDAVGSITQVSLRRRLYGTTPWTSIWTKTVTTNDDFTFTVKDFNPKSRYTYEYMAMPMEGDVDTIGIISSTIKCEFGGFFIGDTSSRYLCNLNPVVDFQPNGQVGVVEALGSQYPFVIDNSIADYYTGKASGLFLPDPSGSNYTQAEAQTAEALDYRNEVIAFLKTKTNKLLKKYDGHSWYIRLKGKPADVPKDHDGASEISFEWVEIAALPTTGVVVV